jgi:radical SAM superfamily enzyme YgiQ (UPF0313 family)
MAHTQISIGLAQISQQVGDSFYFPYSVGLLQAYVQAKAPNPERYRFLPLVYHRLNVQAALAQFAQAQVVGFSLYVWNERRSVILAKALKEANPDVLIVFGGPPRCQSQAENYLRMHPQVDLCCHGPGEQTFLEILERFPERNWQDIAGVSYLQEGQFVHQLPAPRASDLSQFPRPT